MTEVLLIIFIALRWADAVYTVLVLEAGGKEVNPLNRWLYKQGLAWFIIFQFFATALVCVACAWIDTWGGEEAMMVRIGLLGGVIIQWAVTHSNYKVGRRMGLW